MKLKPTDIGKIIDVRGDIYYVYDYIANKVETKYPDHNWSDFEKVFFVVCLKTKRIYQEDWIPGGSQYFQLGSWFADNCEVVKKIKEKK